MAGGVTSAVPAFSGFFAGSERVLVDTGLPGGAAPQSAGVTLQKLATFGFGPSAPVVDAAAITLDVANASQFVLTLTGSGRAVTLPTGGNHGQLANLYVTQDGTGSRTITSWPNVLWAGGTIPTLSTAAGATDMFRFTYRAALGKWFGEVVGKAFA